MKRKFWIVLMMAVSVLAGCGNVGGTMAEERASGEQQSVVDEATEGVETEEESSEGLEAEGEENVYRFMLDESSEGLEIQFDESAQKYEIVDGEEVMAFQLEKQIEPTSATKIDIDGDGEEEYVITACAGRGTGIYVADLMVIKQGREEPIAYLSNEEITEQLEARTKLVYDDEFQMVTLYCDSESEPQAVLNLKKFLEEMDAGYDTMSLGNIIRIDNRDNRYWVTADYAVYLQGMFTPQYDCTIHLTASLTYQQEKHSFSMGDIAARAVDYTQNEEASVGEVITEFYADVTHDGTEDRVVISVPEGIAWDEVLSGVESGELSVYVGYTNVDGKKVYADKSILEREFSPCHAGNCQMFLTTVNGRDYLIETNFWAGQERYTYKYTVFFMDYDYNYVMESAYEEYTGEPGDTSAFFDKLDSWINDSSIVLYAADIDHDPDLIYSTDDNRINPKDYLADKAKQPQ